MAAYYTLTTDQYYNLTVEDYYSLPLIETVVAFRRVAASDYYKGAARAGASARLVESYSYGPAVQLGQGFKNVQANEAGINV